MILVDFTQEQAEALVEDWQVRLRLSDWNVKIQLVDFLEEFGLVEKHRRFKEALIKVCTPHTLGPRPGVLDPEITIVHELLHLHGAGFDHLIADGGVEDDALETMIELVAIALVQAKRGEEVQ